MKKSEETRRAVEILSLPAFVTMSDLKYQYKKLALTLHPDRGGSAEEMAKLNDAYMVIKKYMEQFRFSLSDEELKRQFPEDEHAQRFRF
ncbi:MAG: DnaJ domain-containing protein [Sulfurospirillaceae bacterium]|nr:DnaJ domain-containing protein [Sulfurospirillaceae bacterium]